MTADTYAVVGGADGNPASAGCGHLDAIAEVKPPAQEGCEGCLREGNQWMHLRARLSCGHAGCCDNSPRRDATVHFRAPRHRVVRSFQPGGRWAWCYPDGLFLLPEAAR